MLINKQISLNHIDLSKMNFAKASFETDDTCILIAFIYTTPKQLTNAIETLKDYNIIYDGAYIPLQETKQLCPHANQYYLCTKTNVFPIKNDT